MSHADHAGHDDMSGMTMTTKAPAAAAAGKEPAMDPAMDHSNHGGSTGSSSSDAMAGMGHSKSFSHSPLRVHVVPPLTFFFSGDAAVPLL